MFLDAGDATAVAVSFSKVAGLYNQRVGALFIVEPEAAIALDTNRVLNSMIRATVSTPPAVGEAIIAEIFRHPELLSIWQSDLAAMAQQLRQRRRTLAAQLPPSLSRAINTGVGLYCLLPLSKEGIDFLREKKAVYVVRSGRVNIGGVPLKVMPEFAAAIKESLEKYPKTD